MINDVLKLTLFEECPIFAKKIAHNTDRSLKPWHIAKAERGSHWPVTNSHRENSYKRHTNGFKVPTRIAWSMVYRSCFFYLSLLLLANC